MEPIVPEERPREDQSGGCESETVVMLVRHDRVLCVKLPFVVGKSPQHVVNHVLDELLV